MIGHRKKLSIWKCLYLDNVDLYSRTMYISPQGKVAQSKRGYLHMMHSALIARDKRSPLVKVSHPIQRMRSLTDTSSNILR